MKKVLVIVGPTAVGKTKLSVELAKKFKGEVISGDSMQVYKTLDIGTAKATKEEQQGIPHYLLDVREMIESYSAADFQRMAREKINEITARGHLPIIAGGTGLYIQALLYDFQLGVKEDMESKVLAEEYDHFAESQGNQALWEKLSEKDPLAAEKIHFNNRKKVARALAVFELSGRSIMEPEKQPEALYDFKIIGLNTNRDLLYQRINQRVDLMLEAGLLDEAKKLYYAKEEQGDIQAAQGIGYKEFFPYFEEKETLAEAVEQVKQNSRRYAKRQLTWFRNRLPVEWFDIIQNETESQVIEAEITNWLKEGEEA